MKGPTVDFVQLPSHTTLRRLVSNEQVLGKTLSSLTCQAELFRVDITQEGDPQPVVLDGFMVKPPNFDASGKTKYPLLVHVYGEPGLSLIPAIISAYPEL